jgi:esterase/lipase superfamily enzyme
MPTQLDTLRRQLNAARNNLDLDRVRELVQKIRQLLFAQHTQSAEIETELRSALLLIAPKAQIGIPEREIRGEPVKILSHGTAIASAKIDGRLCPVWFGSNRKAQEGGFGPQRGGALSLGRVDVWVPDAHRLGQTGSSFWAKLKRLDFSDDALRVRKIETLNAEDFWPALRAAMLAGGKKGERDALLYLHGYNSSFADAAIRAAQLHVDLQVSGATAFFSWPSRATLLGYSADEASIEASEAAITSFLQNFLRESGATRVHLIAHSMGNRGLLRALQRIAAEVSPQADTENKIRFGQIFLAAPDVDRDLFLDLARLYPQFAARTTLYASPADRAVQASSVLHDAPRAGYFDVPSNQTVVPGIDTVLVPDLDLDFLGHGYYAAAETLLTEMFNFIHGANIGSLRRKSLTTEQGMVFELGR